MIAPATACHALQVPRFVCPVCKHQAVHLLDTLITRFAGTTWRSSRAWPPCAPRCLWAAACSTASPPSPPTPGALMMRFCPILLCSLRFDGQCDLTTIPTYPRSVCDACLGSPNIIAKGLLEAATARLPRCHRHICPQHPLSLALLLPAAARSGSWCAPRRRATAARRPTQPSRGSRCPALPRAGGTRRCGEWWQEWEITKPRAWEG